MDDEKKEFNIVEERGTMCVSEMPIFRLSWTLIDCLMFEILFYVCVLGNNTGKSVTKKENFYFVLVRRRILNEILIDEFKNP